VGECSFWYRPTRVVPDQRPLNGRRRCCCCMCPSVHYTPVLYRNDWTNRADFWHSTCPIVCYKEIWVSSKIRVHPSGTLSQTPDSVKKISPQQVDRAVNKTSRSLSMIELVDDTCMTIGKLWLFTTSLDLICVKFVVQLVSTIDKILSF